MQGSGNQQITLSRPRPLTRHLSFGCRINRHFVKDRGARLAVDVYFLWPLAHCAPLTPVAVMWPRWPRSLGPVLLGEAVSAAGPALDTEAQFAARPEAKTGLVHCTSVLWVSVSPAMTSPGLRVVPETQFAPRSTWRLQTETRSLQVFYVYSYIYCSNFVFTWRLGALRESLDPVTLLSDSVTAIMTGILWGF